jgi:hypothetical protein
MKSILLSLFLISSLQPTFIEDGRLLDVKETRKTIQKTLDFCEIPYNSQMTHLLLGTLGVESDMGQNLGNQTHDRGAFQINKQTKKYILTKLLPKYKKAEEVIKEYQCRYTNCHLILEYQTILATIYYHSRIDYKKLKGDVWSLAWAWKKYYNTYLGKGTTIQFVQKYRKYVEEQ